DANPAVSVTFQSRAQFASVHGNAYIVRDRALIEKLWSEAWRIWFPGGKDDPSLCLIRVEAREGEYWDNAGTQGVKYVLETVKAYAKGETPNVDAKQNAKVGLSMAKFSSLNFAILGRSSLAKKRSPPALKCGSRAMPCKH